VAKSQNSLPHISYLHRDISKFLSLAGVEHRNGVKFGPVAVDMMMSDDRCAVEADGQTHFFEDGVTRNGESVMKQQIMRGLGLRVVNVSHSQWERMGNVETRKFIFCSQIRAMLSPLRLEI
jgi:very-short-patch-repair endonuclease